MNILITGGAGFIGSNLASKLIKNGHSVTIFDNFERKGAILNIKWLKKDDAKLEVIRGDISRTKDLYLLKKDFNNYDAIYHLAGQVAVTTSVLNPRKDFEVNALGTLNLLELARFCESKALIVYSSTNKVYGDLNNLEIVENKNRYDFKNVDFKGINEQNSTDYFSPYGCSKGCGDSYMHDYHRIYNLNTVVLRQSCIYGPRQFGIEDQGWLAWFMIALLKKKNIKIYGNGKQVRDALFIDDLIDAYLLCLDNPKKVSGKIYNIGGGIENSISIYYEYMPQIERLFNIKTEVEFLSERPGDQRIYITDYNKFFTELNWKPKVIIKDGINRLFNWINTNNTLF